MSVSDFRLTWKLDALKNDSSRVFFLHAEDTRELSLTETYYKDTMKCETALGYLIVSFLMLYICFLSCYYIILKE